MCVPITSLPAKVYPKETQLDTVNVIGHQGCTGTAAGWSCCALALFPDLQLHAPLPANVNPK